MLLSARHCRIERVECDDQPFGVGVRLTDLRFAGIYL